MNENNYPDRLKNPQGRSMQKLRIKRQSNCIRSGKVNLGHPVTKRSLIRSICKPKTWNGGIQKLLGRITVIMVNVPFPYNYHFLNFFKDLWSHALGGSPLFQINLSLCLLLEILIYFTCIISSIFYVNS